MIRDVTPDWAANYETRSEWVRIGNKILDNSIQVVVRKATTAEELILAYPNVPIFSQKGRLDD